MFLMNTRQEKSFPGLPWWLSSKDSACNAGAPRDPGLISELGRSPGGGHGSPFQYSCWENPMNRGGWQATVPGVTKSWIQLKWLSTKGIEAYKTHLDFSFLAKGIPVSKENILYILSEIIFSNYFRGKMGLKYDTFFLKQKWALMSK